MAHDWTIPFCVRMRCIAHGNSHGICQERNESLGLSNREGKPNPSIKGKVDLPSI